LGKSILGMELRRSSCKLLKRLLLMLLLLIQITRKRQEMKEEADMDRIEAKNIFDFILENCLLFRRKRNAKKDTISAAEKMLYNKKY